MAFNQFSHNSNVLGVYILIPVQNLCLYLYMKGISYNWKIRWNMNIILTFHQQLSGILLKNSPEQMASFYQLHSSIWNQCNHFNKYIWIKYVTDLFLCSKTVYGLKVSERTRMIWNTNQTSARWQGNHRIMENTLSLVYTWHCYTSDGLKIMQTLQKVTS